MWTGQRREYEGLRNWLVRSCQIAGIPPPIRAVPVPAPRPSQHAHAQPQSQVHVATNASAPNAVVLEPEAEAESVQITEPLPKAPLPLPALTRSPGVRQIPTPLLQATFQTQAQGQLALQTPLNTLVQPPLEAQIQMLSSEGPQAYLHRSQYPSGDVLSDPSSQLSTLQGQPAQPHAELYSPHTLEQLGAQPYPQAQAYSYHSPHPQPQPQPYSHHPSHPQPQPYSHTHPHLHPHHR